MPQINRYNFSERQRVKAESRAHDAALLSAGRVSSADLNVINGAFSSLEISQSRIRRRSFVDS